MDILISAATHRSGSTMLQRIFNVRKKTLIWGEHNGVLTDFCQLQKRITNFSESFENQREKYFSDDENPDNWIACMNPSKKYIEQAVHNSVKAFFDNLYAEHRETHDIIGFKEVRYGPAELNLFRKCYPNTKIILLVRDPREVWKSHSLELRNKTYNNSVDQFIQKWNYHVRCYINFAEKDPGTYLLKYEDIIAKDPEAVQKILEIGNITLDELNSVLNVKIRGVKRGRSNYRNLSRIGRRCKPVMAQLKYL